MTIYLPLIKGMEQQKILYAPVSAYNLTQIGTSGCAMVRKLY